MTTQRLPSLVRRSRVMLAAAALAAALIAGSALPVGTIHAQPQAGGYA